MKKLPIKDSEARIIVYLSVVHPTRKHLSAIAHKLNMDYSYALRIVASMYFKRWLTKHKYRRHVFYDLTDETPLELAKNSLINDSLQLSLYSEQWDTPDPAQIQEQTQESEE